MMEPLPEHDPVHQLLGKAKQVEPRSDFTRNVMRAIRQEAPRLSWQEKLWNRLSAFGMAKTWATAATCALIAGLAWTTLPFDASTSAPVFVSQSSEVSSNSEELPVSLASTEELPAESEWDHLMELDELLAVQDTGSLSDSQISLLLY